MDRASRKGGGAAAGTSRAGTSQEGSDGTSCGGSEKTSDNGSDGTSEESSCDSSDGTSEDGSDGTSDGSLREELILLSLNALSDRRCLVQQGCLRSGRPDRRLVGMDPNLAEIVTKARHPAAIALRHARMVPVALEFPAGSPITRRRRPARQSFPDDRIHGTYLPSRPGGGTN
jgi:hypothetical protein